MARLPDWPSSPSSGGSGGASALSRTTVKTANYTAVAGDLVPTDPTAGGFTVTLPNAPADKAEVEVKIVTATAPNFVTIATAGADVLNRAGGATSTTLVVPGHAARFQYDSATKIWTVTATDAPMTQLDARFGYGMVHGRGYAGPKEALAQLAAALKLSATQLVEIPVIGDSTTYGAGGNYSWLQRLRDRLVAAGMTDGGKGLFGVNEGAIGYDAPEVNGLVSNTGFSDVADASGAYAFNAEDFVSSTGGDARVVQFRGQQAEILYTARNTTGEFTYTIDEGQPSQIGPVTVTDAVTSGSTAPTKRLRVPIPGAARDSLHTIKIVNRGGLAAVAPVTGSSSVNSGGTYTTGTQRWYKVTAVFAGGETLPGNTVTATVPATAGVGSITVSVTLNGADSYKVYRSTSLAGPYEYVSGIVDTGGSATIRFYTDTGSASAAAGVTPPTTGTTNINASRKTVIVALGGHNLTGVLFQKYARTGATLTEWFDTMGYRNGYVGNSLSWKPQGALGLAQDLTVKTADPYSWRAPQDAAAGSPRPVAAILHMGFNDLSNLPPRWFSTTAWTTNQIVMYGGGAWIAVTGSTNVTPGSDVTKWLPYNAGANYPLDIFAEGVMEFCRMTRSAGAVPIVCTGQFPLNARAAEWAGAVTATIRDTALAHGAIFIDLMEALGAPSQWSANGVVSGGNPHLSKPGYQLQGDMVADKVFIPLLRA